MHFVVDNKSALSIPYKSIPQGSTLSVLFYSIYTSRILLITYITTLEFYNMLMTLLFILSLCIKPPARLYRLCLTESIDIS